MCYTASMIILTVISIERYYAIIHPIKSKHLATMCLLRTTVVTVWLLSALYAIPYIIIVDTVHIPNELGGKDTYCLLTHAFNMKAYVGVNFVMCFICPVVFMAVMYTKISIVLWRTTARNHIASVQYRKADVRKSQNSKDIKPTGQFMIEEKETRNIFNEDVPSCLVKSEDTARSSYNVSSDDNVNINVDNELDDENVPLPVDQKVRMYRFQRRSMDMNQTMSFNVEDDASSVAPESQNNGVPPTFTFRTNCTSSKLGDAKICYTKANRTGFQMYRFKSNDQDHDDRRYPSEKGTDSELTLLRKEPQSMFSRLLRMKNTKKSAMHTALMSRRKVIRLLMSVIISFAMCMLPYHIRLLWQTFGSPPINHLTLLMTPITFLIYYLNNAINPILYAFLSDNFRRSMRDVMQCQRHPSNRKKPWSIHSNTSTRTPHNVY